VAIEKKVVGLDIAKKIRPESPHRRRSMFGAWG